MDEQSFDPKLLIGMLLRRRRWIITVATVLLVVAVMAAYFWPPTYRSTATILVQAQQIPADFARSTITTYADQRIQIITQSALTRVNLLSLIERYGLYPRLRQFETNDEIVVRMRSAIQVVPINASGSTRGEAATIAFRVSFEYDDAEVAQRIASELTTLYLNANVKERQETTAEISTFLSEESERLLKQIGETERKISEFKVRNARRLPEQAQLAVQMIDRGEVEEDRLGRELVSLEEKRVFIEAQLATVRSSPVLSAAPTGGSSTAAQDPAERVRVLRTQLASMTGSYSDTHPDVIRLKREIAGVEQLVTSPEDRRPEDRRYEDSTLEEARQKLAVAISRYSSEHPEVVQLRRRVEVLQKAAAESSASTPAGSANRKKRDTADSPLVFNLEAQLDGIRTQIRKVEADRVSLRKRTAQYEGQLSGSPEVEREYANLTRDLANANTKYRDLRGKLMEAEVAQQLEKDRRAERFTLVEPALLPEVPIKPNRAVILFIGVLLAAVGGVGSGLLRDLIDPSVKSALDLQQITSLPVLAAIPRSIDVEEIAVSRRRTRALLGAVAGGVVIAAVIFHVRYIPLNVAWVMALRKLETVPAILF